MTTSEDYRLYLDSKFDAVHKKLDEIQERVNKTNGIVSEHEKIINQNLPHNISLCPQREIIKALEDNMVSDNAVKKTLIIGVSVIVSIVTIIWSITEIFM